MKTKRSTITTPIDRVKKGDSRTFLSADLANQVIDFINALKKMEGKNGIKVVFSESNVVIELGDEENEFPIIRDGGVYDSARTYRKGTVVVTRECVEADTDTIADCDEEGVDQWKHGTWVSVRDVPAGQAPTWPEPEELYWRMWHIGIGDYREVEVCISGNPKLRTIVGSHVYEES